MLSLPGTTPSWPYSNRGVHLLPGSYHAGWMANEETRTMYLNLLKEMHMSWVLIITAGDSCLEKFDGKEVIRWFLDEQIVPIVRDSPGANTRLPRPFMNMETVEKAVAIYAEYELTPIWKLWNEVLDPREYMHDTVPPDAWEKFTNVWNSAATIVLDIGACPLFPDGPGYDFVEHHPFRDTDRRLWDSGKVGYAVHDYGKNRPVFYPYDDVSQNGTPITEEQLTEDLDDFADDPNWRQPSIEHMNRQRREWASPGLTAIQDDTCFMGWVKIDDAARKTLGYPVVQIMAEGGWVVRDRPGDGLIHPIDDRWALTTPRVIAKKTLAMYQAAERESFAPMYDFPSPFQALCPWLLACNLMGGGGFEDAAWYTGQFADKYGLRKPVIDMLAANSPNASPWKAIRKAFERIQDTLSY